MVQILKDNIEFVLTCNAMEPSINQRMRQGIALKSESSNIIYDDFEHRMQYAKSIFTI